ncbi:MAG: hypothetical protein ACRC0V_00605, partial [Fusobacteriaceae bacterium]
MLKKLLGTAILSMMLAGCGIDKIAPGDSGNYAKSNNPTIEDQGDDDIIPPPPSNQDDEIHDGGTYDDVFGGTAYETKPIYDNNSEASVNTKNVRIVSNKSNEVIGLEKYVYQYSGSEGVAISNTGIIQLIVKSPENYHVKVKGIKGDAGGTGGQGGRVNNEGNIYINTDG